VDGEAGLAALREIGVDFAQGHFISPPSPFLTPASRMHPQSGSPDSPRLLQANGALPGSIADSPI